jgi:hypothetical protein
MGISRAQETVIVDGFQKEIRFILTRQDNKGVSPAVLPSFLAPTFE